MPANVRVSEGTEVLGDFFAFPTWRLATVPIVWRLVAGIEP
jgi:hypothetical protein